MISPEREMEIQEYMSRVVGALIVLTLGVALQVLLELILVGAILFVLVQR